MSNLWKALHTPETARQVREAMDHERAKFDLVALKVADPRMRLAMATHVARLLEARRNEILAIQQELMDEITGGKGV